MSKPPKTPNLPLSVSLSIKVHQPMKDWIAEQGGAEYIRELIRLDRKRKLSGRS